MIKSFYKRKVKFIYQIGLLTLLLISICGKSCPINSEEHLKSAGIVIDQNCVDMEGYQIYVQTAGKRGPNIIFEAGLGDTSGSWNKVVPQIAKFAHTVSYDRAGLGRSESKPHKEEMVTAQQVVETLRTLLAKQHVNPPYILVGHSLGGLYMQLFAQKYPNEVAGVVLVDSATRDQSGDEPLPPSDADYYPEAKGMKESIAQTKSAPSFPNIPLLVLTTSQRGQDWLHLQEGLTKLSSQSKQFITDKSGHHIQCEEPVLVIKAVKEIVDKLQQEE